MGMWNKMYDHNQLTIQGHGSTFKLEPSRFQAKLKFQDFLSLATNFVCLKFYLPQLYILIFVIKTS